MLCELPPVEEPEPDPELLEPDPDVPGDTLEGAVDELPGLDVLVVGGAADNVGVVKEFADPPHPVIPIRRSAAQNRSAT